LLARNRRGAMRFADPGAWAAAAPPQASAAPAKAAGVCSSPRGRDGVADETVAPHKKPCYQWPHDRRPRPLPLLVLLSEAVGGGRGARGL